MTIPQPTVPPAGWYTDPSGQPGQRWWDGAAWSMSTRPTPAPEPAQQPAMPTYPSMQTSPAQAVPAYGAQSAYAAQVPAATQSPYGAQQPYGVEQPYAAQQANPAQQPYAAQPFAAAQNPFVSASPFGTQGAAQGGYGAQQPYSYDQYSQRSNINPSTPGIWLIAFWPLWNIVTNVVAVFVGGIDPSAARYADGTLAQRGLAVLAWLLFVWFAYRDSRELKARGMDRPFGWGWGFIPLVYLIGRTVVVHSRTGKGLAPLFVCIGVGVGSLILAVVAVVALALLL